MPGERKCHKRECLSSVLVGESRLSVQHKGFCILHFGHIWKPVGAPKAVHEYTGTKKGSLELCYKRTT